MIESSTHTHLDIMLALKRRLTVTLDIMCYDDLDVEHMDWKELLELEGDEEVHCNIKEYDPFQSCASLKIGSYSQQWNLIENEDSRRTVTHPLDGCPKSCYITFVPEISDDFSNFHRPWLCLYFVAGRW